MTPGDREAQDLPSGSPQLRRAWPAGPEPQLEWAVVAADRLEHQSIQAVQHVRNLLTSSVR
jgi:hypothetical protein